MSASGRCIQRDLLLPWALNVSSQPLMRDFVLVVRCLPRTDAGVALELLNDVGEV